MLLGFQSDSTGTKSRENDIKDRCAANLAKARLKTIEFNKDLLDERLHLSMSSYLSTRDTEDLDINTQVDLEQKKLNEYAGDQLEKSVPDKINDDH